jgi:tetratricopeptide (TPR) repeat protein
MYWMRVGWIGMAAAALVWASGQASTGFDLNQRGNQASARGDYAEAERLYSRALSVWQELGPGFEAHAATSLVNLGQVFCSEGEWTAAIKVFEEALTLSRQSLGPKHIRTLYNLNLIGNVYQLIDPARSEAYYNEALPVERELYPESVDLAYTLVGLANLRIRAARLDEALPFGEEALAILLKASGEGSQDAALGYECVARIHYRAGRTDRALPLFRKVHVIYDRLYGSGSTRLAALLSEEGMALMADGDLGQAELNIQRAVSTLKTCKGCTFQLAAAETDLGTLRLRQGKLSAAGNLLEHALSLEEQSPDMGRRDMAATLSVLAKVREKERRMADAETLKQRAAAALSYH